MPVRNNILPPRSGLVGEYMFDGNVLDTNDGTKQVVTATNVPFENSPVGYQKQRGTFNGASSSATVPNVALTTEWEFSIRFKVTSLSSSFVLYDKDNTTTNRVFSLQYYSVDNKLHMYSWNSSGTFYDCATAAGALVVGTEYEAVCRWDNTLNKIKIILNGVEAASLDKTGNCQNRTQAFTIGAQNAGSGNFTPGSIGGVRLYNRILTESERLALWYEFNRKLGGGSDFGAVILAPQFQIEYDGTWRDVSNAVNASSDSSVSATDNFGISGKAASFNGSNQRVQFDDSGNYFDFTGPFSIEWFGQIASLPTPGNFASLFNKYDQGANAGGYECQLYNNAGTQQVFFGVSNGSSGGYTGGNYTLPTGTPCHLLFTHDNSTSRIYLDGVEILNGANARTIAANSKLFNLMNFGYYTPSSGELGRYAAGDVYAMRGFASCITADQAKLLIKILSSGKYPYAFNQSYPLFLTSGMVFRSASFDGTNVRDCSGNGKSASVTQGTYSKSRLGQNVLRYQSSAATQNLSMGTDAAFKPTSAFTFATTVIPTSSSYAGSPRLFTNEGTAGAINVGLGRSSATDMLPWVRLNYAAGSVPATARALSLNKPTRYAVTYDGSTVKIYLNGVLDSYASYSGSISYDAGVTTYMSRGINTNGIIGHQGSDILWNRALSYDEIRHDFYSTFS